MNNFLLEIKEMCMTCGSCNISAIDKSTNESCSLVAGYCSDGSGEIETSVYGDNEFVESFLLNEKTDSITSFPYLQNSEPDCECYD